MSCSVRIEICYVWNVSSKIIETPNTLEIWALFLLRMINFQQGQPGPPGRPGYGGKQGQRVSLQRAYDNRHFPHVSNYNLINDYRNNVRKLLSILINDAYRDIILDEKLMKTWHHVLNKFYIRSKSLISAHLPFSGPNNRIGIAFKHDNTWEIISLMYITGLLFTLYSFQGCNRQWRQKWNPRPPRANGRASNRTCRYTVIIWLSIIFLPFPNLKIKQQQLYYSYVLHNDNKNNDLITKRTKSFVISWYTNRYFYIIWNT